MLQAIILFYLINNQAWLLSLMLLYLNTCGIIDFMVRWVYSGVMFIALARDIYVLAVCGRRQDKGNVPFCRVI